MRCCCCFQ